MEQRRSQRYRLQLPLQILQIGESHVKRTEKTRDISSGGVCFLSPDELMIGGRIEYIITLTTSASPVRIKCLGKILRSRPAAAEAAYEVAVTMERYQFVRSEDAVSSNS